MLKKFRAIACVCCVLLPAASVCLCVCRCDQLCVSVRWFVITSGISTMAAAGLGNMVSDWGGIGLQGFIEQKLAGKASV